MVAILTNGLMKFAIPLGFFIWSLFQPGIASYVFVSLDVVFVAYLFFIDIANKPKPDSDVWGADEIQVMRKYHISIRYPFGAKNFSFLLNGIRWSSIIWVPWLLWNHLWIPAGFLTIIFFLAASLSVRLDPFFFLSDAVKRGKYKFEEELAILQAIHAKLREVV
jgi:hypothetical protein